MTRWKNCPAVEHETGKPSGAWVFRDTRVLVTALLENLKDGVSLIQFLDWFREVARQVSGKYPICTIR